MRLLKRFFNEVHNYLEKDGKVLIFLGTYELQLIKKISFELIDRLNYINLVMLKF